MLITSAPIFVLHLPLPLVMMSYLKIILYLREFIKITNRNSIQIKQSLKLKQTFASVLLKKFTTAYKVQKKIPREHDSSSSGGKLSMSS